MTYMYVGNNKITLPLFRYALQELNITEKIKELNLQIHDIKVNYHNTKPRMCINHKGEFCF